MNRTALCMLGLAVFSAPSPSRNSPSPPQSEHSLCSILASPGLYDGNLVLVVGDYRSGPEGTILTEECRDLSVAGRPWAFVNLRTAAGRSQNDRAVKALRKMLRSHRLPRVRLMGRFHWGRGERSFGSIVACCEIEVSHILQVELSPHR